MAKHAIIKSFYASEEWVNLRLQLINERKNICNRCKETIAKSKDIIGHYIIELTPENVNDRMISLNPENIEIVCFDCHNKEHKRFGYQSEREVFLVYGPPMSGKSTFVKENIRRGDIVIDMDQLYSAVSMLPYYDKPDNLFSNVMGIHNQLIDNIKTRFGKWNNAWIIGGYADRYKRNRLADDLGAELIFCDISKEECLRRLEVDEDRKYRKDEWKKYIDKWFATYMK
ncbi:HNH endonuclease signature motif containing protein [Cytobacillus praedii]|uniref:HNH endonuclease n=1 Tax=Cytobacillus praedii TaxID=1742358 RepID=A0A4R1B392_9BACI|nr:HNH endonuclease signature motif containing protein [Cytobacillus praedii]TCJ05053.1 HNH endonuclease [Cytobacillus praedii]